MQELGPNQIKALEALESGNYPQTRYALCAKTEDGIYGYCCLGVFSELFSTGERGEEGNEVWYEGEFNMAPDSVVEALGLYGVGGEAKDHQGSELWELNDGGKTHQEIATIIRQDPSKYFKEPR